MHPQNRRTSRKCSDSDTISASAAAASAAACSGCGGCCCLEPRREGLVDSVGGAGSCSRGAPADALLPRRSPASVFSNRLLKARSPCTRQQRVPVVRDL